MFPSRVRILRRLLQHGQTYSSIAFGKASRPRLVLGIETSCDDTGAAVLDETGVILGESLHSQKEVHLRWVDFVFINHLGHRKCQVISFGSSIMQDWWHHSHSGTTAPQGEH